MKPRLWILPVLSAVLVAACGGGEKTQVYQTDDGLSFDVPIDVVAANPGSTVAGPALLQGPGMKLTFDYSEGANQPAAGQGDVRVSLLSIDGRNAYSEYFLDAGDTTGMPYVATLYVADAGDGKSLAMVIRSADEDGLDEAKEIFRSAEFGEGGGSQASVASADES